MVKVPLPKTCLGCPLYDQHKGFSLLEGDGSSGLMVVAESLGRAEEQDALPLRPRAPSGGVFQRAVKLSGLTQLRTTATITNTIRCKAEAPYPQAAIDHCRQYLDAAVVKRKPRLILALGDVPLQALSPQPVVQSEVRGYVVPTRYGVPMIATFHPSRIARGDWKLFGVMMHDLCRAHQYATHGLPAALPTAYHLAPARAEVKQYIARLQADPTLPAVYDLETEELVNPKPKVAKRIIQIQFSSAVGEAIVLGSRDFDLAAIIFALPNPKWDYNGRLFDRPILRAAGFVLNGEFHDLMELYAHLQAGFVSSKDDTHGDKGVPSRLMSLQSCLSFYHPEFRPWKRLGFPVWDERWEGQQLPLPVRLYGAKDVDASVRVGQRMFTSLAKLGLESGYRDYKWRLGTVLDDLSTRGLPIDTERQSALHTHIVTEELKLLRELQSMVPEELHTLHPEHGYAHPSAAVPYNGVKTKISDIVSNGYDASNPPLIELSNSRGYLVQRTVTAQVQKWFEFDCDNCFGRGEWAGKTKWRKCGPCKGTGKLRSRNGTEAQEVQRWALSLFNPSSGAQVLNYIRYCVREEAAALEDPRNRRWFVPTHIDTGKDSANKAGMEQLIALTDDPTLKHIERCKKVVKLTDYCSGKWVPGDDGRVHAEFRFGSANNQTSATNPPVQTYPKHYVEGDVWIKPIMKRIKATIKAPPGYVMVEIDKVGFHARMQAFLAQDEVYYRLANLDTHSFVTGHYVDVEDKDSLLRLDDTALMTRLKQIKSEHEYERNYMVKRISFLNQYGGGAEKAATILRMPQVEVQFVLDTIKNLFPKSFKTFPKWIEQQLRKSPRLTTPFGCTRLFWDKDMQQAIAFYVANSAHCTIQGELLRLHDSGALDRYGLCNFMHDAGWFCVKKSLARECVERVREEFEKPSTILVNDLGAFTCRSDAKWGDDMDSLEDW